MNAQEINPRVVEFIRVHGLTLDILEENQDGEPQKIVSSDGDERSWTVEYMIWIGRRWTEWCKMVGCRDRRHAIMLGHTDGEFDSWLKSL